MLRCPSANMRPKLLKKLGEKADDPDLMRPFIDDVSNRISPTCKPELVTMVCDELDKLNIHVNVTMSDGDVIEINGTDEDLMSICYVKILNLTKGTKTY